MEIFVQLKLVWQIFMTPYTINVSSAHVHVFNFVSGIEYENYKENFLIYSSYM